MTIRLTVNFFNFWAEAIEGRRKYTITFKVLESAEEK